MIHLIALIRYESRSFFGDDVMVVMMMMMTWFFGVGYYWDRFLIKDNVFRG